MDENSPQDAQEKDPGEVTASLRLDLFVRVNGAVD